MQNMEQEEILESDARLFVKFYMGNRENPIKSAEAGHPVFDDVPFVRVIVPGDKNTVIDTPVREEHKQRFPQVWERFQKSNGDGESLSGMPIREWPAVTRGQCEELAYLNILTVEQLAAVSDGNGAKIMNFNALKRKALAYLEQAKDSAFTQKVIAENGKMQEQITFLTQQIKEQNEKFKQLQEQISGEQHRPVDSPNRRK